MFFCCSGLMKPLPKDVLPSIFSFFRRADRLVWTPAKSLHQEPPRWGRRRYPNHALTSLKTLQSRVARPSARARSCPRSALPISLNKNRSCYSSLLQYPSYSNSSTVLAEFFSGLRGPVRGRAVARAVLSPHQLIPGFLATVALQYSLLRKRAF